MKILTAFILILSLCSCSYAYAGDPGPVRVVWVNLDIIPSMMDVKMKKIILGNDSECWSPGNTNFYMSRRPPDITNNLVSAALIKSNKNALKKLNSILREHLSRQPMEFDGVVAYSSIPSPRFWGYTQSQKRSETVKIRNLDDSKSIDHAFCLIVPEVVRKP